jgi:O-antigen/teichoic acid export membrane protein
MKFTTLILRGGGWTIAAFGASQALRLATNIALARLLAPELFGIMAIVTSVSTGVALMTDAGIGQNIVVNRNAEKPEFYDTAWTINLIRGLVLSLVCLVIAGPVARFYGIEVLTVIFPVAGLAFVFGGLSSMAPALVQKRLRFKRLNAFDLALQAIGFPVLVLLAVITPTIWALVFSRVFSSAMSMIGSYVLLPGIRHRPHISREYAGQIVAFSKWIFISSIAWFLSMNFDRLYLGKVIPLDLLGVYGIARALSEPVSLMVMRLSGVIIFPLVAASVELPRPHFRAQLASIRLVFLLAAAVGLSTLAAGADLLVSFLYDQRYQAAGWMAPLLIAGAWFSVIGNLNESTLMGLGKPAYGAVANGLKLGWLMVGLPLGFAAYGPLGAVIAVAAADLSRYAPVFVGQLRARFSFGRQDLAASLLMFGLLALWEWLRWVLGFATLFDNIPIAGHG